MRQHSLRPAIDLAGALQAESVSLISRAAPSSVDDGRGMDRLTAELRRLLDHAETAGMTLALEPEPGMFVDTHARFGELDERLGHPLFQLTLGLGHCRCLSEGDVPTLLRKWKSRIVFWDC